MKLSSRRLLVIISTSLIFTACGSVRPPQPPSLQLPKPPSDLHATRKGDKVILTWTVPSVTTDHQTARNFGPTRICRGLQPELVKCGTPVGQAPAVQVASGQSSGQNKSSSQKTFGQKSSSPKLTGFYSDELPPAMLSDTAFITYSIEVPNSEGKSASLSNQVHVSLAVTLPPPQDFSASVTSQGIVLNWASNAPVVGIETASPQTVHYLYRVYRREEGSKQQTLAGEVASAGKSNLSLTDSTFEWEKTYEYHAEAVTVVALPNQPELQVEGDDTSEVKVFADDTFPPAVPSGLQAVFSGPGQQPFIDLIWASDTDADLNGYNVYRHEEGADPVKLNKDLVKTPAYRDMSVTAGKHYFYSISAVDLRGNESARSEETGESVP
jgi:hypothetical protein